MTTKPQEFPGFIIVIMGIIAAVAWILPPFLLKSIYTVIAIFAFVFRISRGSFSDRSSSPAPPIQTAVQLSPLPQIQTAVQGSTRPKTNRPGTRKIGLSQKPPSRRLDIPLSKKDVEERIEKVLEKYNNEVERIKRLIEIIQSIRWDGVMRFLELHGIHIDIDVERTVRRLKAVREECERRIDEARELKRMLERGGDMVKIYTRAGTLLRRKTRLSNEQLARFVMDDDRLFELAMRIDGMITEDIAALAARLFDVPEEITKRAYEWKWRKIPRDEAIYSIFLSIDYSVRTVEASRHISFTRETVRRERMDTGLMAIVATCLLPGEVGGMIIDGTGSSPHMIIMLAGLTGEIISVRRAMSESCDVAKEMVGNAVGRVKTGLLVADARYNCRELARFCRARGILLLTRVIKSRRKFGDMPLYKKLKDEVGDNETINDILVVFGYNMRSRIEPMIGQMEAYAGRTGSEEWNMVLLFAIKMNLGSLRKRGGY